METKWFIPSRAFIKKAVEDAEVVDFLKQIDYADPVYMITGIKTVGGASVTTSSKRTRGWKAFLGIDATATGAPISIGPDAADDNETSDKATFENSSRIVFAYQLLQITSEPGTDKKIESKNYATGALFGAGEDKKELKLELREVEGLNTLEVFDEEEEEECLCVLPEGTAPE